MDMLSDVVVVDLTRALAGPHAAMMLGDLGARVIKVESPDRRRHPAVGSAVRRARVGRASRRTSCPATATRSRSPPTSRATTGKAFLRRLVAQADVLMENFRPGVLDRLGFSVEELHAINPGLVIMSITGFGHDGPEGGRAGYDQIAQGEAGLMSLTGPGPGRAHQGRRTDRRRAGRHVRRVRRDGRPARAAPHRPRPGRAHQPAGLRSSACTPSRAPATPWPARCRRRSGNHHASIAPYGLFRTADSAVQIAVGSEGLWQRFARLVGLAAGDPRFATNEQRVRTPAGAHRRRSRPSSPSDGAETWLARLAEAGHPGGQGAHAGRGLQLGPDPLAGTGDRGRAPDGRPRRAARPAAAVRRQHPCRWPGEPPGTTHARPARRNSVRAWLDEIERSVPMSRGPTPRPWSRWCSTRDRSAPGTSPPVAHPMTDEYAAELAATRERTGLDESVMTGEGSHPWPPGRGRWRASSASSPARSASPRPSAWSRAVERATDERLPLLAAPASGGTRMQEGTVAFIQMVKITAALARHKAAGPALPGLPAPPDHRWRVRVVGVAGPRDGGRARCAGRLPRPAGLRGVVRPGFPEGVQIAENLSSAAWSTPSSRRRRSPRCSRVRSTCSVRRPDRPGVPGATDRPGDVRRRARLGVDDPVAATRPARRTTPAALRRHRRGAADGTGEGEHDPGLLIALARFGGSPACCSARTAAGRPGGSRSARRAARGTARDAAGRRARAAAADRDRHPRRRPVGEAEEGGLAGEIAVACPTS